MGWTVEERQEYFRNRYRERRDWAIEILGGKCVGCGSENTDDLQFDHADPTISPMIQISNVIRAWSKKRLLKCFKQQKIQLLCSDCHAEKTARERKDAFDKLSQG